MIIFSSEAGVIDLEPCQILEKGRLGPGKMLLVDLKEGRIYQNDQVKRKIANAHPYRKWLENNRAHLQIQRGEQQEHNYSMSRYQQAFGYTIEEVKKVIGDMALNGNEPISSMGNDMPLAVLSNHPQLLYNYFKQLFAQVTNPPIDAIRESFVTSTTTYLGPSGNFLHPTEDSCKRIILKTPILSDRELAALKGQQSFQVRELPIVFQVNEINNDLETALQNLFTTADQAIQQGVSFIILSDKHLK